MKISSQTKYVWKTSLRSIDVVSYLDKHVATQNNRIGLSIHLRLVTPYNDIELNQHWLR